MSDQEHKQQNEKSPEEREETLEDLEVPEEEKKDVSGGWSWGASQEGAK